MEISNRIYERMKDRELNWDKNQRNLIGNLTFNEEEDE